MPTGKANRQHQLVYIAGCNVFLGPAYPLQEGGFGETRVRRGKPRCAVVRRDGTTQRTYDFAAQALALSLAPVVQQRDTAGEVIEYEQRTCRDEVSIRCSCITRSLFRQTFEVPDDVVSRVADQPAGQRDLGKFRSGNRRTRQ